MNFSSMLEIKPMMHCGLCNNGKIVVEIYIFRCSSKRKVGKFTQKKKMKFVFTCKHRVFQLLVVFFATVEVLWKFCGKSQVIL